MHTYSLHRLLLILYNIYSLVPKCATKSSRFISKWTH